MLGEQGRGVSTHSPPCPPAQATPGCRWHCSQGKTPGLVLGAAQCQTSLQPQSSSTAGQQPGSCQLCGQEENGRGLQGTLKTLLALPIRSESSAEVQLQPSAADISNVPLSLKCLTLQILMLNTAYQYHGLSDQEPTPILALRSPDPFCEWSFYFTLKTKLGLILKKLLNVYFLVTYCISIILTFF